MRIERATPISLLALCGALGAGCPNAISAVRLDVYPEAYAEVFCERLIACCEAAELDEMYDGIADLPSCEASLAAAARRSVASAEGTSQRYDSVSAGQCLDAIELLSCPELSTWRVAMPETRALCDAVFVGTRGNGASCASSGECEGVRVCVEGACADPLAVGADCSATPERCPRGVHCWEDRCRTPQPAGAPCSAASQCNGGGCEGGVCVEVIACDGR